MRKFTLLIMFVSFSIFAFSQSKSLQRTQKLPTKKSSKDIETLIKPANHSKAIGEVIWKDDFSAPNKWVISNKTSDNQNWVITKISSTSAGYNTGTWVDTANVSEQNGYALFDSDGVGADGGSQNADITTKGTIDLTNYPNVEIRFRQRVNLWQNTVTNVQITTDNGTTWTTYNVNAGRPVSTKFEETVGLNISAAAGGKPNVRVRFNYVGQWDYLWSIDDVQIVVSANNEMVLNTAWLDFAAGGYARGYFSNIPASQEPVLAFYKGAIFNNGTNNQTNVRLNVEIDDNDSILHTVIGDSLPISLVGAKDTIYADTVSTDTYFLPELTLASYNVNFNLTQDQVDEEISNNDYKISFNVTDTVFARDVKKVTYTGPSRYTDGVDGDKVGVEYYISKASELSSLSVFISEYSDTLTSFIGKILLSDGTNLTEILTTDLKVVKTSDLGKWISIPFIKDGTSEFIADDQLVYAVIECYFKGIGDEGLYVGADNSAFHDMTYSYIQLAGSNFFIDAMPMVRLNLEPTLPCTASILYRKNVSCLGGNDGKAVVSVGGCVAPYSFLWSNGSTNDTISNLTAGVYTVTVTDANSMISTATVTISSPDSIQISAVITNEDGYNANNGNINVSVLGGTPSYKYSWSNGSDIQDLENIGGGSYVLTVTDANKCISSKSFDVADYICTLNASSIVTNETIFGSKNGAIDLTVSGGTTPYSILWSNDSTKEDLDSLVSGLYNYTITDAKACVVTNSLLVDNGSCNLVVALTPTNVLCNGVNSGAIALDTTGSAVSIASYKWSNNETTQNLINLSAGVYTVTVTDSLGCLKVVSATVSEPTKLQSVIEKTDLTCNASVNGSANLTISGGISPYTITWSNDSTSEDIIKLVATKYIVTIVDANLCVIKDSVVISEPQVLSSSNVAVNVICKSASTGSANLSVSGGTSPYSFAWSNSAISEDLSGLVAGEYTVIITDANSCTAKDTVTILEPAAVIELAFVVNGPWETTSGTIDLTVTGGVSPYTYAWSNDSTTEDITIILAGNYSVTVTDNGGCVVSQTTNAVGIENIIKSNINVYPNPTNGMITLTNVENSTVSVFNILGEQVLNTKVENKNLVINMNALTDGTYIVKIVKDGKVMTEKITLKK